METITIGKYEDDPEAQACVKPADNRWQLVIDKDGYPHLYVQVNVEDEGGPVKGLLCIDDMLPEGLTIRDLMDGGAFGGKLTTEEEAEAQKSYAKDRQARGIPFPR